MIRNNITKIQNKKSCVYLYSTNKTPQYMSCTYNTTLTQCRTGPLLSFHISVPDALSGLRVLWAIPTYPAALSYLMALYCKLCRSSLVNSSRLPLVWTRASTAGVIVTLCAYIFTKYRHRYLLYYNVSCILIEGWTQFKPKICWCCCLGSFDDFKAKLGDDASKSKMKLFGTPIATTLANLHVHSDKIWPVAEVGPCIW